MKAFGFLTSFLVILSMLVELAMCDKTYTWNVSLENWSPDGVESTVIAINGQFPGPTIRATVGEKIVVNVTNLLPEGEGLSIHWHGLRQKGTPEADGTANISQCPTLTGETFNYEFTLDKAGTHFYHGHYKMERVQGLYGMLIVEDVNNSTVGDFVYDDELEILLSDWWHKNYTQQEDELSSNPMVWIGEPQSLLINGRGQYGCFMAPGLGSSAASQPCNFNGSEQWAPKIFQVSQDKTYRIRLVSATSLASLNFAIENHTLQVVEADGNLVNPFQAENVYIFPGQSYSLLIKADQLESKRYWVSASVVARKPNTTQGLAVLSYDTDKAITLPTTPPPLPPVWNDTNSMKNFSRQLFAKDGSTAPAPQSNKHLRLYLLNTQNIINGLTKWAINNISLLLPATPYLAAYRYNLTDAFDRSSPPTNFSSDYDVMKPAANKNASIGDMIYNLDNYTTVDVILQNANALANNTSETHPWHLHGHDFWVLGYGEGKFSDKDEATFNMKNPPSKNTEVVYPFGWTALRFLPDNPGVWAFHCHIEPHMHMGMGVVFAEGTDKLMNVPTKGLQCGKVPKKN